MKYKIIIINSLALFFLFSCSPTLNFYEIEQKINDNYQASSEGDIDYLFNNTPVKSLKKYGEKSTRDYWNEVYANRSYPVTFSNIGELEVKNRNKCNSFYFYKVNYIVDEVQTTPYLDSTALKLNETEYGKENVHFNKNLKILQIRKNKSKILVFDKDKRWKVLDDEMKYLKDNYGEGFSDCISNDSINSK